MNWRKQFKTHRSLSKSDKNNSKHLARFIKVKKKKIQKTPRSLYKIELNNSKHLARFIKGT